MTTKKIMGAAVAAALGAVAPMADGHAQDKSLVPGLTLSGTVGFVTDYSFRGLSQTDRNPTVQGSLDFAHTSGAFASVWASGIDFNNNDAGAMEIDYTIGYKKAFGDLTVSGFGIYYSYPGSESRLNYDYFEVGASVAYEIQKLVTVSGGLNYSPDFFGGSGEAWYGQGNVSVALPMNFSIDGHLGYQWVDKNRAFGARDYWDWTIGVSRTFPELFDLKLSINYGGTDIDSRAGKQRFIFQATKTF